MFCDYNSSFVIFALNVRICDKVGSLLRFGLDSCMDVGGISSFIHLVDSCR
jgi:hypothetical protein